MELRTLLVMLVLSLVSDTVLSTGSGQPRRGFTVDADGIPNVEKSLHNSPIINDRHHMQEHMKANINLDSLSDEEVAFHFFESHDLNKDNQLDGLELYVAILHIIIEHLQSIDEKFHAKEENRRQKDLIYKRVTNAVDSILEESDVNNDGYLSYVEYVRAARVDNVLKEVIDKEEEQQLNKENK